jgi:hypothetical protein
MAIFDDNATAAARLASKPPAQNKSRCRPIDFENQRLHDLLASRHHS